MTRPRAADDFPTIRARMEELRRERIRPRAADDFPTIRARMEELRRERYFSHRAEEGAVRPIHARPCHRRREDWIGPKAEAAPHASATARRAPIVRAAS